MRALAALISSLALVGCKHTPPLAIHAPSPTADFLTVRAGDFVYRVHASAIANLSYQLDCMAGLLHCTVDGIKPLWTPGWLPEDDVALAAWKQIRSAYQVDMPLAGAQPATSLPVSPPTIGFDKRLRVAALLAEDREAYERSLSLLLPSQDADALMRVVQHFWPRFDRWWQEAGSREAARFQAGLVELFLHGPLGDVVSRVVRFYAAPLPVGTPIDFDIIALPSAMPHSAAEQVLSHAVIEVPLGDTPAQRMDVVCHELFHYFFNSRTSEQKAALAAQFTASSDSRAALAYFLLDEAVATALGNGVVGRLVDPKAYARRRARDGGFYLNHAIDATAKGLLARTHDDPSAGASLDAPETVAALIAATREAIGTDPRPIEYLHWFGAAFDSGWENVLDAVSARAVTNNQFPSEPFDSRESIERLRSQSGLSTVILVPRAEIARLTAYDGILSPTAIRDITSAAKTLHAFAYVFARAQSRVFVVVADDATSATHVVDTLFAEPTAIVGRYLPKQ